MGRVGSVNPAPRRRRVSAGARLILITSIAPCLRTAEGRAPLPRPGPGPSRPPPRRTRAPRRYARRAARARRGFPSWTRGTRSGREVALPLVAEGEAVHVDDERVEACLIDDGHVLVDLRLLYRDEDDVHLAAGAAERVMIDEHLVDRERDVVLCLEHHHVVDIPGRH